MIDARLIILDGLSGSGKSGLCRWLEQQLPARFIYEFDTPHPLHWWDYWDGSKFYPPDFDRASPAAYIENSLDLWRSFVVDAQASDQLIVLESPLFCLGVNFLLQGNAQPAQLIEYGRQVEAIITDLRPALIYLRQGDIARHHRRVWDERGLEYEQELIGYKEATPYLRARGLTGVDGIIALWEETQRLTDIIYAAYTIRKMSLETSAWAWEDYRRQIQEFLQLEQIP